MKVNKIQKMDFSLASNKDFLDELNNKKIMIGSQNCYQKDQFSSNTAAVSSYMIRSVGAKYTLVGHSDNRGEGDTDTMLKDKVRYALKNNLKVVFCIGENKTEKKNKKTLSVLKSQLTKVFEKKFNKNNIIVAYEPIWAIGTGATASPSDAQEMCSHIRSTLASMHAPAAEKVRIQYGGSVNASNVNELMSMPDVDGALVGGASLKSKEFCKIIDSSSFTANIIYI